MKPLLVGITGGIGAGKSVVCKIFMTLGVPIYDADSRAKWLMKNDESLKQRIQELFGPESFLNNELDREFIGKKAFHNPQLLNELNGLVHPVVAQDFKTFTEQHAAVNYVIKEAALLIETGSYTSLDHLILVTAPLEVRLARVKKRDTHRTRQDIEAIISKQLSDDEKIPLSDTIIVNDNRTLLIPQVLKLHEQFNQ